MNIKKDYWEKFIYNKKNKIKNFNNDYEKDLNNYITTINNTYKLLIENNSKKNILIFGFIQSGKTDYIIGLILKLFNNSFGNIVFSINQNNKDLLQQTISRTKEIYDENIFNYKNITKNKKILIEKIRKKENIIFFLLKEKSNLKIVKNLIEEINTLGLTYNALIIDDEADSASHYDIFKDEYTEIFSNIKSIKENSLANYISITATPFVHILLKDNETLKPNYAFVLKPSTGYTGILEFINNLESSEKPIFHEIEKIEKDDIDELAINPDFNKAICFFVVQCYWWKYIKSFDFKPRMLININRQKNIHFTIKQNIIFLINRIINSIEYQNNLFDECLKNLNIFEYKEDFYKKINIIANDIDAYVLNGDIIEKTNLDKSENEKYRIIIGHNKLDRGLTIVDLINVFICSRSNTHPNADSILQQARFIGYRQKYFEYIRVFLTNDLINDYREINDNINYFFEIMDKDRSFLEVEKFIPLTSRLFPTRNYVADFEYIDSNDKIDIINNKFYFDINELDEINEKFYKKTIQWNKSILSKSNLNVFVFDNLRDFFNHYNIGTNINKILSFFSRLVGSDTSSEKFLKYIIKWLTEPNKKIYIRITNENKRILTPQKLQIYHTIGKGNYCSNEYEYLVHDNILSIDIIPLNVYSKDKLINKKIYRTRIFIPRNISRVSGYNAK